MSDGNYIFNIKTVQTGAIRILIESLKEILTDANFTIDENGIKLIAMDSTANVLVHMKLFGEKFEYFFCSKKINIGLNLLNLYKLIKTMSNNDTLTLFMETNNENELGIKIHNDEKNSQTTYKLNLLDIEEKDINIPPAEFDTELTFPSGDFQKIIRDMINISEKIEIKSIGNKLMLSCNGDFASQETVLGETDNGIQFTSCKTSEYPIQGIYSLKYLILFTKCTNLCNIINIYIKNDYPLIIKYNIASIGDIKLCLAPISNNNN
uniref:Proliferating cell nuclear antigen PCNA N-terminal domain-containing protein n=1 Tax=viral metagenome TaxID=1070528 RepID=A0A6C0C7J8_9ZZZZ